MTPSIADSRTHAAAAVRGLLDGIDRIGHDPDEIVSTGYRRFAWTDEDARLRAWFRERLADLDLVAETDRAGNLWGWWLPPHVADPGAIEPGSAVTTGSHLDSVPDGGRFDGPLGVCAALAALALLRERGLRPARPIGVVVFSDEEGARFGTACFGSRVLTGVLPRDRALATTDAHGTALSDALEDAGIDVVSYGPDPAIVARIGAHVELHVEQGYALAPAGAPLGIATGIWPHGRWHATIAGEALNP